MLAWRSSSKMITWWPPGDCTDDLLHWKRAWPDRSQRSSGDRSSWLEDSQASDPAHKYNVKHMQYTGRITVRGKCIRSTVSPGAWWSSRGRKPLHSAASSCNLWPGVRWEDAGNSEWLLTDLTTCTQTPAQSLCREGRRPSASPPMEMIKIWTK